MDLIQKAKALCLSACLEAVIAIICICAYAIAVDVLQISQYSTLTKFCCIFGMVSVMGAGWDSFLAFKLFKKYLSSQGNR